MPGLWDMHVHAFVWVFSQFAGPLMIANGITGTRDMGWHIDTTLRWRADIAAGREVGPRLVAGARIDGAVNKVKFVAHVVTEQDGVRAVDTLAQKKDGQQSIEHEDDLMRACTSRDSLLRARFADTSVVARDPFAMIKAQAQLVQVSYDPAKCKSVIATLARNHTWVTPTLVVYQPYAHSFDSASTHPEWARYVPGLVQGGWVHRAATIKPADSMAMRSYFSFNRTRELKEAGVKLLAGTDMPQAFVYPGFSLHQELELLVRSGLTPLEALRTATYSPAEFLGALDSLGTVAQGKVADLLLLDANPLADIRNTRRIAVVIANGRVFDEAARAQLLNGVESALKH
jgi:hypothetical protein